METVKIVKEYKLKVWIEGDLFGGMHVMMQHQTGRDEPFEYCTFHYDYMYTDNSSIHKAAEKMALSLGADDPVEYKVRDLV